MKLTENARIVLEKRYLKKEQGKVIEKPDDLFHRVAKNVAEADKAYVGEGLAEVTEKDFYELLTSLDFLPNSPTLMNAGRDLQQLSACFVIPVGDSMEEIFDAVKTMAVIQKSGGGTGFSFTRLRPSNDFVGSTSGVASGPVSFMKVFNETTETVKQGGCWVGDTLISTVEGNIPIKDLVGKQTWVYSWDHLGEKVTVKRTDGSWKTSDSKEIWELKTENGICIKGTLDHPIMLRSGEYRKLSELKTGTPLMPLRVERRKEDVYIRDRLLQGRRIRSNEARKILSHFVYEELTGESIPQGFVLHHKDGNHFNNRPENWELKMPNLHAFDPGKAQVQAGTHIFVNRVFPKFGQDNGMHKSNFWANKSESELLEYKKKIGSPGDLNPMRINPEARRKVSDYAKSREAKDAKLRGRILKLANKVLEAGYNWSDWSMALKNMGLPNHQRIRIDSVLRIFGSFECLDRSLKLSNDRVLSVKFIGYEAAYNLEVEDTHNYVVTNGTDPWSRGIFVSNTRRGANMAVLSVHHPDILRFISCKEENDRLNNFNISVAATDVFMEAVKAGGEYDLINPRSGEVVKKLNAREVFDQIVYYAWKNGDPGIIFIDKINRDNPTPELGLIESTNPCWAGTTKVWTVEGSKSFKELVDSNITETDVLSIDSQKKLCIKRMRNISKTRANVPVVELVLERKWKKKGISKLYVTPDHNLYLSNGEKVKVNQLNEGDSIFSLYRYKANSKGYQELSYGKDTAILEHVFIAEQYYGAKPEGFQVHHKNEIKYDNRPDNLEYKLEHDHGSFHKLGERNPMSGIWDERNPLFGRSVDGENNGRYRKDIMDSDILSLRSQGLSFRAISERLGCCKYTIQKRFKQLNHKVISVKYIKGTEDVYNGVVDDTHCYFVMCGENDAILSANCGEQPLLPYESCNLGSINLAHMVYDGKIDWAKLRNVTQLAIHFLDNVIDMNHYTLPQIEEITKANRKIGLGVMGWSDMLIQLGLPYAEPRSLKLADEVMLTIATEARDKSARLGKERGSFPNFEHSTLKGKYKTMRNATVTTIAPTGSISLIAGCSSGIEPMFAVAFKSVRLDNTELLEVNPFFRAIAEEKGFYSEDLMSKIVEAGTLKDFKDIPPAVKKVFATAHDITPEDHIKMQSVFQKHIDNAVSKTINFPKDATAEEVAKVYLLAHDMDCKGVTIYRDMSRDAQVLYKGSTTAKTPQRSPAPKRRGDVTKGYTKKVPTGCGSLYVTLNEDEETGQLFEVFARIGKAGGCASSQSEAVGRLASMALRAGMDPEEVIEQLRSISCHTPAWTPGGKVMSCADAISKALEWYQGTKKEEAKEEESKPKKKKKNELHRGACPNCGGNLMYTEGCAKCLCGYSECG